MPMTAYDRIDRINAINAEEERLQSELFIAQNRLRDWSGHSHLNGVIADLKRRQAVLQNERASLAAPY